MADKLSKQIKEMEAALEKFEEKVQKPIKAQKGGPTWLEVIKAANGVVAALNSPVKSIKAKLTSVDKGELKEIPISQKQLVPQLQAVKLLPVTKYMAEHGPGGSKQRTSILKSASSKKEEAARVQLCADLIDQVEDLMKRAKAMAATTSKDFS